MLDLKDRKILYQLDLNCRQSNTQIGKKVGLRKDIVSYRINRMEEKGVITGYWTDIDSFKLGYDVYRIYIKFQNATTDIKNEIIQYFSDYTNIYSLFQNAEITIPEPLFLEYIQYYQQLWDLEDPSTVDHIQDMEADYVRILFRWEDLF